MFRSKAAAVFAAGLALGAAAALANSPDPNWSTARTSVPAGVTPVLYNLPNGQGAPFTQAGSLGGLVDATITLTLVDAAAQPVAGFSRSDLWLEKEIAAGTGNFMACTGGTIADAATDADGVTTWANPLRAGGWSTSRTLVVVNGSPLQTNAGLVLRHNSADLNGDGAANLTDLPLFAGDYFGAYAFRSDLLFDGAVNLSDIPRLAQGAGAVCP